MFVFLRQRKKIKPPNYLSIFQFSFEAKRSSYMKIWKKGFGLRTWIKLSNAVIWFCTDWGSWFSCQHNEVDYMVLGVCSDSEILWFNVSFSLLLPNLRCVHVLSKEGRLCFYYTEVAVDNGNVLLDYFWLCWGHGEWKVVNRGKESEADLDLRDRNFSLGTLPIAHWRGLVCGVSCSYCGTSNA